MLLHYYSISTVNCKSVDGIWYEYDENDYDDMGHGMNVRM